MAELRIDRAAEAPLTLQEREETLSLCPFGAIVLENGALEINARCKLCRLCAKNGPAGLFALEETAVSGVDKSEWNGMAVYIEISDGNIHPVSLELIGKARELAAKCPMPVIAIALGEHAKTCAEELRHYGVDRVCVCTHEHLRHPLIEPYTDAMEAVLKRVKPSSLLIGATAWGRGFAPRVAARMGTGVTADCTRLDIKENTDLVQIRPAFGGNIMAQIITPSHRPQLATVRYKIFDAPERMAEPAGEILDLSAEIQPRKGGAEVLAVRKKAQTASISDAELLVALGRGVQSRRDLVRFEELAGLLGAQTACTRPLVESGWMEPARQIGLSGRSVKPKMILSLGVSGAIQYRAGMENAELIVTINEDASAPLMGVSHVAVVGDMYEITEKLKEKIRTGGKKHV